MKTTLVLFFNLLILNMTIFSISFSCYAEAYVAGFDMKNFKLIEVNFVESQLNNSTTNWKDREVNFGYKNEPVSEIVKKIMVISGKEVIGLEQLADSKPSMVIMTKVKAIKAVTTLLKCAGFKMVESEEYFQIVEDKKLNKEACLY